MRYTFIMIISPINIKENTIESAGSKCRDTGVSMVIYPLSAFRAMGKSAFIMYYAIKGSLSDTRYKYVADSGRYMQLP